MPDENGTSRATLASLEQQVRGLERSHEDTVRAVRDLASEFRASLSALTTSVAQTSTTQWPTIWAGFGAVFMLLSAMGWMAYSPIQRDTARLDTALSAIIERGVFQRGYESDQVRLTDALRSIRSELELVRVRSYEHQGEIASGKEARRNTEARLDAISRRLAEFIRDMGKH